MAAPKQEIKEQKVQGQFSTAEVTHVLEAIRMEGQCYVKNHLLMQLSNAEQPIREWHDNVTRANLERLRPLAKEMGIALPFAKPLEDRENEMKQKIQGAQVRGILQEGEAIAEVKTTGVHLLDFYATSVALATHDRVREAFRSSFEAVADQIPRTEQALKGTESYYPPPMCQNVGLVGPQGVPP